MTRPTLRALAGLLLLLQLALPVAAAAQSPSAPTAWGITGAGRLVKPGTFALSVAVGADGLPRGLVTYVDTSAQVRMRATRLDAVSVADGSATISGAARNRGRDGREHDGYAFRMVATEARGGQPARLVLDLTAPDGRKYQSDSGLKSGSVRIAARNQPRGRPQPTATPPEEPPATEAKKTVPTPSPTPTATPRRTQQAASPTSSAKLVSQDSAVSIEVPAGAIAEAATFSHTELAGVTQAGSIKLARSFKLEAQASGSRLLRQFAKPLSLTVRYTDADLAALGVPASKLQLYYQDDSGAWIRIPATVDPTARTVTAAVDHFTVFALGTGEAFETAGTTGTSFTDNFANLNAWQTASGASTLAGGILTGTGVNGADDRFMLRNSDAYTDLTYEAAVNDQALTPNHRVGLILRYSAASGGSYYFAYLNNGRVGLGKVTNGGVLTNVGGTAPVDIAYTTGAFVWVRVAANGPDVTVSTAPAATGPWTQRLVAVDNTPLTSGAVGLFNENGATGTTPGRFQAPRITITLPQDWSGVVNPNAAHHVGVIWDKTSGSPHGGAASVQLFSGNAAYVGHVAQTTNNPNICGGTSSCVVDVSGWVKTSAVSTAAGDGAKIAVVPQPSGSQIFVGAAQTGTVGWTRQSGNVTIPAGTTSIEVRLVLDGSGVANFDDLVVNLPIVADGGLETAGPAGVSYFDDNLAEPTAFQFSAGGGSLANGVFTTSGTPGSPGLDAWTVANSDDLTDFTWIAAVNPSRDDANLYAGLQFRWQSPTSYYAWVIRPGQDRVQLIKRSGASFTTLQGGQRYPGPSPNTYATILNTWYWLRVVVVGNQITGSIAPSTGPGGGPGPWTQFATYTDATPIPNGRVGLGNAVVGATAIPASFKSPSLLGTFPVGWQASGINQVSGRPGAMWDRRAGTARGGTGSMQIYSGDVTNVGYVAKGGMAVAGSTSYDVAGWIKTAGVTTAANGASIVVVESPSGVQTSIGNVSGTVAWTRYTGTFVTQPATTSLELRIYLKGSGTANFDDIAIASAGQSPVPPPPPPPPMPTGQQQSLYGVAQTVGGFATTSALPNSVVQPDAFDGNFATATGTIGSSTANSWTWSALGKTSFATVTDAFIQVRFYQSGWSDDTFALEYTTDNWVTPRTLATYSSSNAPPATVTTFTSTSLKSAITGPVLANAVQVRLRGVAVTGAADNITLNVDQVRLTIFGTPPALDLFDRADSTTKLGSGSPAGYQASGSADTGQTWQTDGSVWGIAGNQAYAVGPAATGNYVRLDTNSLPVDQTATVVVPASFDGQVGLLTRVSPDWYTTMVWVGLNAAGAVEVWTLTNGTWNGPIATGTATLSFPMTLSSTAVGTSLTVKVNNQVIALSPGFTIPNSGTSAAGAGMYVETTGAVWARFDSFEVR